MNIASDRFEQRVIEAARAFPYPPTPNIARRVGVPKRRRAPRRPRQQFAWALTLLAVIAIGLLAVPPVRARMLSWLRIGAIEIVVTPTPARNSTPTRATQTPAATRTPRPSPTINPALLDLTGATTLADAQTQVRFPIRLPTRPADLGPPDKVFVQQPGGAPSVILVWLQPGATDQVRLALYELGSDAFARKMTPDVIDTATVNRQPAVWVQGPHMLEYQNGDSVRPGQLITGNVLIWTENDVTYRLETGQGLEETVQIAESLR